jgi:pyridoxal phosphate enzyme (YggS family)
VQEGAAKAAELAAKMPDARWHLIGRLQSNKAAVAVRAFSLLHGIDSLSTSTAAAKAATREGRTVDALLQVRLGGGEARGGVEQDAAEAFLRTATAHEGIRFVGLMGVADPEADARPQFARLRLLGERLAACGIEGAPLGELSMGMTGDFEDAIAEGATIVRIGTAIFGERPPQA